MKFIKKFFKKEELIIPKEYRCDINTRIHRIKKIFPDISADFKDSGEYELWLLEEYGKIGFKLFEALTFAADHKCFRLNNKYSDSKIFEMAKAYYNSKYNIKGH